MWLVMSEDEPDEWEVASEVPPSPVTVDDVQGGTGVGPLIRGTGRDSTTSSRGYTAITETATQDPEGIGQ